MEKQDIKNKKARGRSVIKICIAVVIVAALIFGATMALRSRVVSVVVINGDGMADSMRDSERWAVDRLKNDYSGGDIVTFKESEDSDDVMVSRVVAVAGDELYIDFETGDVYVNGSVLDEPYISEKTRSKGKYIDGLIASGSYGPDNPIKIEDGQVFVMGDNRNNARDSRNFGPVDVSLIEGTVFRRIS